MPRPPAAVVSDRLGPCRSFRCRPQFTTWGMADALALHPFWDTSGSFSLVCVAPPLRHCGRLHRARTVLFFSRGDPHQCIVVCATGHHRCLGNIWRCVNCYRGVPYALRSARGCAVELAPHRPAGSFAGTCCWIAILTHDRRPAATGFHVVSSAWTKCGGGRDFRRRLCHRSGTAVLSLLFPSWTLLARLGACPTAGGKLARARHARSLCAGAKGSGSQRAGADRTSSGGAGYLYSVAPEPVLRQHRSADHGVCVFSFTGGSAP